LPRAGPGERFGGRQPGSPNKITADLKEMIHGALDDLGGRAYLVAQGRENPVAFMGLVGKIIPKVVIGDIENPLQLSIEDKRKAETAARQAALEAIERAFNRVVSAGEGAKDITPVGAISDKRQG
jgi:hypothetical protein